MAESFTGHYIRVSRHTKCWEFHQSLRGVGSRHIQRAGSFTGHYVGVSRLTSRAGSFTGHYVGVFRHTPRAGSFTGHYVVEVLDTHQGLGVSPIIT